MAAAVEYTGVALGTYIIVKMLGWGGTDKVMKHEDSSIENTEKGGRGSK